ncbi:MAG: archease [Candidatus Pacearchaeota archaeon]
MAQKYKFLSHTADIKFQAFGNSLEEVFKNSALALSASVYEGKIENKKPQTIEADGSDLEALLLNFLEEFLVLFDSENFILGEVENLEIERFKNLYRLKANVLGDDIEKYETSEHVKAITYNEMFVKQSEKGGWETQVVLDV